jgi:hypothetical protein
MSKEDYQDGFGAGIEFAKETILEWADTWTGEDDLERLCIMRDKLIEVLEKSGLDFS